MLERLRRLVPGYEEKMEEEELRRKMEKEDRELERMVLLPEQAYDYELWFQETRDDLEDEDGQRASNYSLGWSVW